MRLPLLLAIAALAVSARAEIDFAREVRPILSDHCFACHGPDAAKRRAGLRLDEKESAFGEAESGEIAIVPGDPEKSELVRRITTTDRDDVMPPPKEHKQLQPEQVALLKEWIKDGAKWTGHWAFVAAARPTVPGIADCGLRIGRGASLCAGRSCGSSRRRLKHGRRIPSTPSSSTAS